MFSSFPNKIKKYSSQKFDYFTKNNPDGTAETDIEKEAGPDNKVNKVLVKG